MALPAAAALASKGSTLMGIGSAADTLGSLGRGGGVGSSGPAPYMSGIGSKILGAPGDPAGFIYGMIDQARNRKNEEKRYQEQLAMQKERSALENMLLQLQANKGQEDQDWRRGVRNAFMRG